MTTGQFTFEKVRDHLLFQSFDDDEWQMLVTFLVPRRHLPAQIIFEEGDFSNDLFLILSGVVELRKQFTRYPGDYLLATLHSGRIFGETSLLTNRRRTTTAIAITTVETAVLSARNLDDMPSELQVKLHRAWGQIISEQLHLLDGVVTDLLEQRGAESAATTMATMHQRLQSQDLSQSSSPS